MVSGTTKTIEFKIEGMDCGHCVKQIEATVGGLPGVEEVKVSLASNSASVTLYPEQISEATIFEAVEDAGFDVPR
nr:heavy-metal-associated domain-containing protein [Rhizobium metallidurans]